MPHKNILRLAFYDSGIGGFSVLKEFFKFFNDINESESVSASEVEVEIHYIADSARAPYGARSLEDIRRYVHEFSDFVDNLGVDYFISACNTSSNLFGDLDFSSYKFQTLNLFSALNTFLNEEKESLSSVNLHYLATKANIASGRYKDLALKVNPVACPKLVPLIEKFNFTEAKTILESEYLQDIASSSESNNVLILGCTHYALIKHLIATYSIIDPAELILKQFSKGFKFSRVSSVALKTYSTGENSSLIVSTKELTVSKET